MTKSTITREQLIKKAQEQIEFCRHTKITGEGRAHVNQCAALFEIALAAMDGEPVYQCEFCHADASGELQWHWEDVNKDFYEQYDSERRGQRRILYSAPQPAPEMTAIVERLNLSGYEYEGGEVTPQNVAAVVDILLQQLDDAVQGQNPQPAPECEPVRRFNADQMHRICLEANRHMDKYGAMAKEVNKLLGRIPVQPALVPDKMTYQDGVLFVLNNDMSSIERGTVAMRAWNACRAAMLAAAPQEVQVVSEKIEQSRKKIDRCDVCTEGARGGCGTCIFNGNFE